MCCIIIGGYRDYECGVWLFVVMLFILYVLLFIILGYYIVYVFSDSVFLDFNL